jgi:hypothetical protein
MQSSQIPFSSAFCLSVETLFFLFPLFEEMVLYSSWKKQDAPILLPSS